MPTPTLPELLAQHKLANETYCKMFAANRAVTKRLAAARVARRDLRKAIHVEVGPLHVGSLVMNLTGTRFFEIAQTTYNQFSHVVHVHRQTGERGSKPSKTATHRRSDIMEWGSMLPVSRDHPVYVKWEKRRFRDKLEGKE